MKTSLKSLVAAAVLVMAAGNAQAWWGPGWGNGWGNGWGDGGFSFSFGMGANTNMYGYNNPYYGYFPHYGYPAYGAYPFYPPVAPQAPAKSKTE